MALFKVLKGQEANLPKEKKEGWAYVTFVDKTIPVGQQYGEGSMYVDIDKNNRIKINMHADMASMDDQHQSIAGTYIKDIALKNGAAAPYYELKYGNNTVSDATHAPLPIASAANAGILTADKTNVQILTGPKKIDANGSLEISKTGGFNYSGIDLGTTNQNRTIWFSDSGLKGKPVTDAKFMYNPASTDPWNGYSSEVTGTAATKHGVLTADRLQGIAYQAFLDTNKVKITSYLRGMQLVNHATQPYYTLTDGDSLTTNVNLPVAGLKNAGVVTTGLQIFAGEKHFENGLQVYTKFNYVDIKDTKSSTANANNLIWFSTPSETGVPIYSSKFTFNQKCADEWSEYSSGDTYSVINVDRLNGLARYAVADSNHNKIDSYYVHSITTDPDFDPDKCDSLCYYYSMGDNMNQPILIPEASLLTPGIISWNTQYIWGTKLFGSSTTLKPPAPDENRDALLNQYQISVEDHTVVIVGQGKVPLALHATDKTLPPMEIDSSVLVEKLNVDLLDGFHASNATFEWSTADAASEQVIPTRSAICRSLNNLLQASQALYYKGTIDPTNSSSIPSSAKVGDVYIFSKAGTCFNQSVEAGDMAICSAVNGNTITWNIVQMNIDGAVRSSTNSTNNAIPIFDGTSGKVIKSSTVYILDSGNSKYFYGANLNLGLRQQQQSIPINTIYAVTLQATTITGGTYTGGASLTGTPTAPTAAEGTNTTQIATTAFVTSAITNAANDYVLKIGDTMTGPLTAPVIELNQPDANQSDIIGIFAKATNLSIAGDINSSLGPVFLNAPTILSHDINDSGHYTSYTFSPTYGVQILSDFTEDGDSAVIGYTNEAYGVTWTIDVDGFFNGWASRAIKADNATKLYVNNDTTSKLYVLGATSTGNQSIYRESSVWMQNDVLYGAAWNDYAEFRQGDTLEPGKCVVETGDDTLTLATGRMIPGASIVSDTFGFSIGETEKCKTPIAVSGRVLAYPHESREEFKKNIGRPVCSGPNGTVSIMTDEEYREKGYCALGTISAVPDYEEWGTGNVKVNNRVWIHVK